ncbi:hypothetical protein [Rugamonas rubra]|uniref:Uncharacterized protein n=1 Tax=Rugamonas rubra TaxID=758825 RepID=A0A1I4KAP1_9BURK|nr:hypothetical protein [Rugamonas rubra]SFL75895.1 hypothetical protein SAMN02982985_01394 [Rugamonas rubra]
MTAHIAPAFYQPLIVPADRLIRAPLSGWRRKVLQDLLPAVRARAVDELPQQLNLLALQEAYRGNLDAARQLCDAQIRFWQAQAAAGQPQQLLNVIQPWINLIRLERWQERTGEAAALYQQLAPQRAHEQGELQRRYGIGATLAELCAMDRLGNAAVTLQNAYWQEYPRLLLKCGMHQELNYLLQDAQALPLGPYLKAAQLEMQLSYQSKIGLHRNSLAALEKMMLGPHSPYWLQFKVLEVYLAFQAEMVNAPARAEHLFQALTSGRTLNCQAQDLYFLAHAAQVFRQLHLGGHEIGCLDMVEAMAAKLGDEVFQCHARQRLAELGQMPHEQVLDEFQHSAYVQVRSSLGLRPDDDAAGRAAGLLRAVEQLAALDYDGCARALALVCGAER